MIACSAAVSSKGAGSLITRRIKLFSIASPICSSGCSSESSFNDTTNAFKAYRRTVIEGCRPLISPHFNLTVELPLKAIVRGYTWTVIPITWRNRRYRRSQAEDQGDGQPLSSLSAPTSGWRNISAAGIIGRAAELGAAT